MALCSDGYRSMLIALAQFSVRDWKLRPTGYDSGILHARHRIFPGSVRMGYPAMHHVSRGMLLSSTTRSFFYWLT